MSIFIPEDFILKSSLKVSFPFHNQLQGLIIRIKRVKGLFERSFVERSKQNHRKDYF